MRRPRHPVIAVAVAGAGIALWWRCTPTRHERGAIRGSGIIEVTQVDVAFEVPGRMVERFVDEGAMVDEGEPIARLDDREYRLQVERAAAAKAAAEARYHMMLHGPRAQEIDQALAALEVGRERRCDLQQREYERIAKLAARRHRVAERARPRRSRALPARARPPATAPRAQLDHAARGLPHRGDRGGARRACAQAQADARARRARTWRAASSSRPLAGRVLSKSREAGEMVQPGTPIVTIGDLTRPWVNLYVGERDLGKVAPRA